ncbi:unnamed protein product [Cuscuta campestris]|uniref:Uncharacterized protein n=1 Tax=Cuscuta campestris TaxID=132261 RepID=A0A484KWQ5_9ASTE|nr:unnamed protein product [Cuscuta campestris]
MRAAGGMEMKTELLYDIEIGIPALESRHSPLLPPPHLGVWHWRLAGQSPSSSYSSLLMVNCAFRKQ